MKEEEEEEEVSMRCVLLLVRAFSVFLFFPSIDESDVPSCPLSSVCSFYPMREQTKDKERSIEKKKKKERRTESENGITLHSLFFYFQRHVFCLRTEYEKNRILRENAKRDVTQERR
jgi:hypothetical protein